MKKLLLLIFAVCSVFTTYAQVKCDAGHIDIGMTFKRAIIVGNDAIIDFTLTNYSRKEIKIDMDKSRCRAYDDEGNCYLEQHFMFDFANTEESGGILPSETTIKLRCYISDIDEYATNFTRIELQYFLNCYGYFTTSQLKKMTVRNVGFVRD